MSTFAILEAVRDTLAGIDGTEGVYTYDLSPDGLVRIGNYSQPPARRGDAFACCYLIDISEQDSNVPTNKLGQVGRIMIAAWASVKPTDVEARMAAMLNLLDDVRTAIRGNPTLTGTVHHHTVSVAPENRLEDAQKAGRQVSWAPIYAVIRFRYREGR